jgi:ferredoxin
MAKAVGFDNDVNLPIICRHCGICAHYCPHGCLTAQEVPD